MSTKTRDLVIGITVIIAFVGLVIGVILLATHSKPYHHEPTSRCEQEWKGADHHGLSHDDWVSQCERLGG